MSFSADWLDLRAPADRAARDPGLLAQAADWLAADPVALDLGSGTGAMARVLAARWRLVDRDPALLAIARRRAPGAEVFCADLADLAALPLAGIRLVTASALLDLMPGGWIEAFADRLAAERIAAYATLSYDGRIHWLPALPGDEAVRSAFNAHQLRDKGLGPALGPVAAAACADALARRGYRVLTAASPWRLGPGEAGLQGALIDGIAAALAETGSDAGAWARARRAAIGTGSAVVGHVDMLALPASSAQSKITSVPRP